MLCVAVGAASACSSASEERGPRSGSVWTETTHPFDPACTGCEDLGTATLAHMGEARLLRNTAVDDPEAQWTHCVNGILDCIEQGKGESACVAASKCPEACKADYRAHRDKLGDDVTDDWTAIKAVFVSPASRCALASASTPEVVP